MKMDADPGQQRVESTQCPPALRFRTCSEEQLSSELSRSLLGTLGTCPPLQSRYVSCTCLRSLERRLGLWKLNAELSPSFFALAWKPLTELFCVSTPLSNTEAK